MDSALGFRMDTSFGFSVQPRLLCITKKTAGNRKTRGKIGFLFYKSVTQVLKVLVVTTNTVSTLVKSFENLRPEFSFSILFNLQKRIQEGGCGMGD